MTIRILPGCTRLVAKVREYFAAAGVTAEVAFGDRELPKHINQGPGGANRVVFVPFVPKSGAAGQIVPPELTGPRDIMSEADPTVRVGTVRALFDWKRLFIVSIWVRDAAAPEDDEAQHAAAESLLEKTAQAVHYAGFASIELGAIQVMPQGERRFGVELRTELRLTHPLYDAPQEVAHPEFEITRAGAPEA